MVVVPAFNIHQSFWIICRKALSFFVACKAAGAVSCKAAGAVAWVVSILPTNAGHVGSGVSDV
jgi:hypothetical protein